MKRDLLYRLYVDKHGILRMVMEIEKKGLVRGIDISNFSITRIAVDHKLRGMVCGSSIPGSQGYRRNKVIFTD